MNILVIRTHRLGDILQLMPLFNGLKKAYPDSRVYFLTGEDHVPLIEGDPRVDAIIPFPEVLYTFRLKHEPEQRPKLFNAVYDLAEQLRGCEFDLAINRQYEMGALFAFLSGAKKTLGGSYRPEAGFHFDDEPARALYRLIQTDRRGNRINLADWSLLIAGLTPDGGAGGPYLKPSAWARYEASKRLGPDGNRPLVAVHMGAARSFRQWGRQHFSEIISWLATERGKAVVLTGGEEDQPFTDLPAAIGAEVRRHIIDLTGKTPVQTLGAVLERCETILTGDTGPMHLAAAVGTPVMALFYGTAYPWETGPYGPGHFVLYPDLPCAPCKDPALCPHDHRCKQMIGTADVKQALDRMGRFHHGDALPDFAGPDGLKLLVTGFDEKGFQVLRPFGEVRFSDPETFRPKRKAGTENDMADPGELFLRADAIVDAFLGGHPDDGFRLFGRYLEAWSLLREDLSAGPAAVQAAFAELLVRCEDALTRRDTVLLTDLIEYHFKPLVAALADRGILSDIMQGRMEGAQCR